MRKNYSIAIILFISLVGIACILFATRWGVGTSPDAVVYIGAARNLVQGKGLSVPFGQAVDSPMTHHAPLYPTWLGAVGLFGVDPLIAARWLNAILFGLLILSTGYFLRKTTQTSHITPILGSLIILSASPLLEVHSYAWTEPAFLLLGLSGMYTLAKYIEKPAYLFLFWSAILMSLATLTRYAGIALIGTGLLSILLFSGKKLSNRLIGAFAFGLLGAIPLFVWMVRNSVSAGTATSRNLVFHPITKQHFVQLLDTLSGWLLLPAGITGPIKLSAIIIVFGVLIAAAAIYLKHKPHEKVIHPFIFVLGVFIVVYPVFLILSISFLDANTPLDNRILSPLFAPLTIVIFYFLDGVFQSKSDNLALKTGLITITITFSAMYIYTGATWVTENSKIGLGFSSHTWQGSEFSEQIRALPEEAHYFSNAPHAAYILTGNPVRALPKEKFATSQQENPEYVSEMREIQAQFGNSNVFVIQFSQIGQASKNQVNDIIELLSLDLHSKYDEGLIYITRPENER